MTVFKRPVRLVMAFFLALGSSGAEQEKLEASLAEDEAFWGRQLLRAGSGGFMPTPPSPPTPVPPTPMPSPVSPYAVCGTTIRAGEKRVLNEDLDCANSGLTLGCWVSGCNSVAIVIEDGGELDCQDYSITGSLAPYKSTHFGIIMNNTGSKVTNCKVTNFDFCIEAVAYGAGNPPIIVGSSVSGCKGGFLIAGVGARIESSSANNNDFYGVFLQEGTTTLSDVDASNNFDNIALGAGDGVVTMINVTACNAVNYDIQNFLVSVESSNLTCDQDKVQVAYPSGNITCDKPCP